MDLVQKLNYQATNASGINLHKEGTNWKINDKLGDSVFILQLLNDLSLLEATDFPQDLKGDFGFSQPKARFDITLVANATASENKESLRSLIIGKSANIPSGGKGYYAIDNDKPQLPFIITEEAFEKLVPKAEALVKVESTPQPLLTQATK